MKFPFRIILILSLFVLYVIGRRNRQWHRGRRCHCRAILATVNSAIEKKLTEFKNDLLTESLSKPTSNMRDRLVNLKMQSLSHDFVALKALLDKHSTVLHSIRRTGFRQTKTMRNTTHNMYLLDNSIRNMSLIMRDLKSFLVSNQCRNRISNVVHMEKSRRTEILQKYPRDCDEVYLSGGLRYPGDFYIYIQPNRSAPAFRVQCQLHNSSGWAIFQRRTSNKVDFYRTWQEYRNGFGDITDDFWLGNEKINQITKNGHASLRLEMTDWRGNQYFAEYERFSIADEESKYAIEVSGYHGTAGDSLTSEWQSHSGQPFSTYDRDNDKRYYDNCARDFHGAWWFRDCFQSHLNGRYVVGSSRQNYFAQDGILWKSIHPYESLKSTTMMIRYRRLESIKTANKQNV